MDRSPFRVAIVGGGVCGITCAIALLKEGIDVHIYEAAAQIGEAGAGIGIGYNAERILEAIDVWKDVVARARQSSTVPQNGTVKSTTIPAETETSSDQQGQHNFRFISGMAGHETVSDWDPDRQQSKSIHRAIFLDALVRQVDPERIHLRKRCTHITTPADGVIIHFQDETTAVTDVVLGADGIQSAVRRHVTDSRDAEVDPYLKFSRNVWYRALIPASKAAAAGVTIDFAQKPVCFVGEDKYIIAYSVQAGTMINMVAIASESGCAPENYPAPSHYTPQRVTAAEVLAAFQGWGPEVTNLLRSAERLGKWEINVVYPPIAPQNWTKGRVAILGDAAHGMLPHQGASQGIEDVYLLAKLLGHPQTTLDKVCAILQTYAAVRQPRAQNVWEGSRRSTDMFQGRTGGIQLEEIDDIWHYVWDRQLDADLGESIRILIQKGVFAKAAL